MRTVYNEPGFYRIRVAGWVSPEWADRLGGLSVRETAPGVECLAQCVELTGWLADQAALYGVLNTLYDHRYPLLSVEYLGPVAGGSEEGSAS